MRTIEPGHPDKGTDDEGGRSGPDSSLCISGWISQPGRLHLSSVVRFFAKAKNPPTYAGEPHVNRWLPEGSGSAVGRVGQPGQECRTSRTFGRKGQDIRVEDRDIRTDGQDMGTKEPGHSDMKARKSGPRARTFRRED